MNPRPRFPRDRVAGQDRVDAGGEAEWQALRFHAGERSTTLDLGGVRLRLRCADDSLEGALRELWRDFVLPEGAPVDLDASIRAVERIPFATPVALAAAGRRGTELLVKMRGLLVRVDPERRSAAALVERAFPAQDLGNLLRLLLTAAAARGGAFVMRAAAIEHGGKAVLFAGPSHAGKSTVARLAAPREVLTDDALVLRERGGTIEVETAGFWGMEGSEGLAIRRARVRRPAAGVFVLGKAGANSLARLAPAPATLQLVSSLLGLPGDGPGARLALDFAARLARRVGVWALAFHHRDGSYWELVERALRYDERAGPD